MEKTQYVEIAEISCVSQTLYAPFRPPAGTRDTRFSVVWFLFGFSLSGNLHAAVQELCFSYDVLMGNCQN